MSVKSLNQSLDAFFKNDDQVLILKGDWGIGKTYRWDLYIKERIRKKDIPQIVYTYVSLFGKTSLTDLKSSIFQSGEPIEPKQEIKRQENLLHRAGSRFNSITRYGKNIPGFDRFSRLANSLEYWLVENYVICFDDLERKGKGLSVKEIMGLLDELARQKNCKVVLIFNENLLDSADKEEFEEYREKIVDAEIEFRPSHTENIECVISRNDCIFNSIEKISVALNLRNIRVIKKIKRLLESLWSNLEDLDELLITEIVNHATLLSWSYYLRGQSLPLVFIMNRLGKSSWIIDRNSQKKELSADEKQYEAIYKSIISQVDLYPSRFDEEIIQYLKYGYSDSDKMQSELIESLKELDSRKVREKLVEAQNKYIDFLSDNKNDIVLSLVDILETSLNTLSLSDCSVVLSLLDRLGQDVSTYVYKYMELHEEEIEKMNYHDSELENRVNYIPLLDRCKKARSSKIVRDIDTVLMRIANTKGWNPGDLDFLLSITEDELYQWIKGDPPNLSTKLRGGLLFFKNMSTDRTDENEKYKHIYQKTHDVIVRLAQESSLNCMRAKDIYHIETP